ncbi:deoxycytidine-triphosphate deaminase related protein [Methanothermus fervidus DSM 2088]|uniref:Deoxycytidine-triphosphate deaminase related protein n=1 Tax=Methanothermus fervidus (strain ATCC 43054 / DSM 2088 / JCM 10308 / V24 S) TaxID=523846 RepID=E3GZ03_METFV|nr:deoxycytidine-triphosphate deaminase related protein [Methanothermus fervidus DSM 2088]
MIIGEKELRKIFRSKDIQPAGIDLRLKNLYEQKSAASLINEEKNLPKLNKIEGPIYELKPGKAYLAETQKIKIPRGYAMLYFPRSTLIRSFVDVRTALGDPGFEGKLYFLIVNHGEYIYKIKKGERFAQAVLVKVKGSGKYNGDYQNFQIE